MIISTCDTFLVILNSNYDNIECIKLYFIRVVTLKMSPVNDMFLSGSLDRTLRLWDLRSPNCQVTE